MGVHERRVRRMAVSSVALGALGLLGIALITFGFVSARPRARRATCLARARQIGLTLLMYA
jgi:hypothetical protein